jgi:nucleotide-binding universal stress UspA family protein
VFDTVIVPLDGSAFAETAVRPAAEVARETGASLVPMMVVENEVDDDHRYLKEATSGLAVPTRPPHVVSATDAGRFIAGAGESENTLVVMTTHGSSGVTRAVLGSVAERVLRLLRKPLLLVGPQYRPGHELRGGRMMVPLDGSKAAEAILPFARDWSRHFDIEPWPVSIVDPEADTRLVESQPTDVLDSGYVNRISDRLARDGLQGGWEVLRDGDPAGALAAYSRRLPASLVAMTTHGRTGLARLAMGSVAARVVHDSESPLLILRPEELADG